MWCQTFVVTAAFKGRQYTYYDADEEIAERLLSRSRMLISKVKEERRHD